MTQSQGFGLANIEAFDVRGNDAANDLEGLKLIFCYQFGLEFRAAVKIVCDRTFTATRDEDHHVAASLHRLVDCILNERAIDDRQHLFGNGFGGWEKAGAKSSNGEDGFAQRFLHEACKVGGERCVREFVFSMLSWSVRVSDCLPTCGDGGA